MLSKKSKNLLSKKVSKIRVSKIRVSEIRGSEIRVTEIRVTEIRISSNHREVHGAIFSSNQPTFKFAKHNSCSCVHISWVLCARRMVIARLTDFVGHQQGQERNTNSQVKMATPGCCLLLQCCCRGDAGQCASGRCCGEHSSALCT